MLYKVETEIIILFSVFLTLLDVMNSHYLFINQSLKSFSLVLESKTDNNLVLY